jgi:hypothetical protein
MRAEPLRRVGLYGVSTTFASDASAAASTVAAISVAAVRSCCTSIE